MMKRLAPLMAVVLAFSFTFNVPDAEARKFGGGKFGRSFNTAPAPQRAPAFQRNQAERQQAAGQTQRSSRKGMLGGMLGGLLAGGLIASLLGGGAFGGIQMMDIIILGLLAFVLFRIFRGMNRPRAMAGNHRQDTSFGQQAGPDRRPPDLSELFGKRSENNYERQNIDQDAGFDQSSEVSPSQGGFTDSDVPFNLPADFNLNTFMNGARDHYRTVQEGWNKNNMEVMREYLHPELFEQMKAVRAKLEGEQHTEVMFVDAEMVRADYTSKVAQISVKFSGKYRDMVEGVEEDINDIWHLERDLTLPDTPWLIVGIEG
ncbi:MAG: Tim44 domain-containing protein [Endozoicomonas sp.]